MFQIRKTISVNKTIPDTESQIKHVSSPSQTLSGNAMCARGSRRVGIKNQTTRLRFFFVDKTLQMGPIKKNSF